MTLRKRSVTQGEAPPAALLRLTVRVRPGGPEQRYRAGLGPFGPDPAEVDATAEQAAALEADPWLEIEARA